VHVRAFIVHNNEVYRTSFQATNQATTETTNCEEEWWPGRMSISRDRRAAPSNFEPTHSRCVVRGFEALSEATPPVGATPRTHRAGLNGGDDGWQDQRLMQRPTPGRDLVEVEGIA